MTSPARRRRSGGPGRRAAASQAQPRAGRARPAASAQRPARRRVRAHQARVGHHGKSTKRSWHSSPRARTPTSRRRSDRRLTTPELEAATSTKQACELLGKSRATHYRRSKPPVAGPPTPRPVPPNAPCEAEREHILAVLRSPECCDLAPAQVWAGCSTTASTCAGYLSARKADPSRPPLARRRWVFLGCRRRRARSLIVQPVASEQFGCGVVG